MFKIMLDAGHYGKQNRSPCNRAYWESEMAWKLHRYLREELLKYDCQVDITRADEEKDMPVYNRGAMAKGYNLFLSLHSNAVGSRIANGTDRPVIVYPVLNDLNQKDFAKAIGETVHKVMKTKQKAQPYVRPIDGRPTVNYYGVLRGAVAVGCKQAYIIEHGFHTDTYCTNWLLVDSNLRAMAKAEAKTIAEYFNLEEREEPMTKEERAEFDALKAKVAELDKNCSETYNSKNDLPKWATNTKEFVDRKYIEGDETGKLRLSYQMVRIFEIVGRMFKGK